MKLGWGWYVCARTRALCGAAGLRRVRALVCAFVACIGADEWIVLRAIGRKGCALVLQAHRVARAHAAGARP